MYTRVRVDTRGRIVLPKEVRDALGIREGEELILSIQGSRIILMKSEDPFRKLERIFGDLTFERDLRRLAEKEAMKEVKG